MIWEGQRNGAVIAFCRPGCSSGKNKTVVFAQAIC